MKVLQHVMRNINEFNIPSTQYGYDILYFGVNLILMFDYRLSFDVEVKNSTEEIEVLILSRKEVAVWKADSSQTEMNVYYKKSGIRISDTIKPSISDAYAFIINNRTSSITKSKNVVATLVHTWAQEVRETQLKERRLEI
jgi:hypothetical protein